VTQHCLAEKRSRVRHLGWSKLSSVPLADHSRTDLSTFNNHWYNPGRNVFIRVTWFTIHGIVFKSWLPGSSWRAFLLRLFGARMGKGIVIKPGVSVKYPWKLVVGDYSWLGESVWIDNLATVNIGNHCCVSQGALLLCGNHNYKRSSFDLLVNEISLKDGVWIGARGLVAPGVTCHEHSVLAAGGVATRDLEAYGIYTGNPARKIRDRMIQESVLEPRQAA